MVFIDILDSTMTSTYTNKFDNTLNGDPETFHDSDDVPASKISDSLEQTSPVSGIPILGENNSVNVTKNDDKINLSINEESNSSTCKHFKMQIF